MTRSSFLLKIYNFSPRLAVGGKTLTVVKPFSHKKRKHRENKQTKPRLNKRKWKKEKIVFFRGVHLH